MSDALKQLIDLDLDAKFYGGEAAKPAQAASIAGHAVSIEYTIVQRKCYDGLATPTMRLKVDGKRMAWKAAVALFRGK